MTTETDDPDKIVELSERGNPSEKKNQASAGKPKGTADKDARRELFKQVHREAYDEVALEGLTEQERAFGDAVVAGESLASAYLEAHPEVIGRGPSNTRLYQLGARLAKKPAVRLYISKCLDGEEGDISHTSARLNNFIIKRLEHEAQTAHTDGARLKALELLAKHKAIAVTEDLTGAKAKAERSGDDVLEEIATRIAKLTGGKQ